MVSPTYVVTLQLYVSGKGSTPSDRLQNGAYAQAHITSYTDMVDSNAILQAVRARLGLLQSPTDGYADLADSITATNPFETAIINVTVQDTSAEQALMVASAIGAVFDPAVAQMENTTESQSPVSVNVLSAPTLPSSPSSPSAPKYVSVGLVVGLAVGAGAAYLIEFLSPPKGRRVKAHEHRPGWSWGPPQRHQSDGPPQDHASEHKAIRPIRTVSGHGDAIP